MTRMALRSRTISTSAYADPINHSRLYQNFDQLADQDLFTREELDARTNVYTLTDAGKQLLQRHAETLADVSPQARPVADGGDSQ